MEYRYFSPRFSFRLKINSHWGGVLRIFFFERIDRRFRQTSSTDLTRRTFLPLSCVVLEDFCFKKNEKKKTVFVIQEMKPACGGFHNHDGSQSPQVMEQAPVKFRISHTKINTACYSCDEPCVAADIAKLDTHGGEVIVARRQPCRSRSIPHHLGAMATFSCCYKAVSRCNRHHTMTIHPANTSKNASQKWSI